MKPTITSWILAAAAGLGLIRLAGAQTEPARLAAESLRHDAQSLLLEPDATARAGRIFALVQAAEALKDENPATCRILADIYAVRSQPEKAAEALANCLRSDAVDDAMGRRWLSLRLAALQTADDRIEMLEALLDDTALSGTVRAEAAVELGRIRLGQNEKSVAAAMFLRALRADPGNPEALSAMLQTRLGLDAEQRGAYVIRLHQALPRNEAAAVGAASALGELGLHSRAVDLFDYIGKLREKMGIEHSADAFISARCNALLDAGRYDEVIGLLEPMLEKTNEYSDLYLPLIEAYQRKQNVQAADDLIGAAEKYMKAQLKDKPLTAETALRLGWFYVITKPDAQQAMSYAQAASQLQPDSPLGKRVYGISLLQTKQAEKGAELLEPLVASDPWAAVLLAQHYLQQDDKTRAVRILERANLTSRSGPAARQLAELAGQLDVKRPQPKGAAAAAAAFDASLTLRNWVLQPQLALRVELQAPREQVVPGEGIEVVVALQNRTDKPLPMGPDGLARPMVALKAVTGGGKSFASLPMVVLPSGRLLQPHQTVRRKVRIDVADLQQTLIQAPFSRAAITVSGTFDPGMDAEGQTVSLSSSVKVDPVVIVRSPLVSPPASDAAAGWRQAYQAALMALQRKTESKDVAQRAAAARQVASLLAAARRVELGEASLPAALANVTLKSDAFDFYRKLMLDPSPVVRAEMVSSLRFVPLSRDLLKPLGRRFDDPSWLVRLRVAETVGQSDTPGRKVILDYLAADKVAYVVNMARAFLGSN